MCNIDEIMGILYFDNKGRHINIMKKCHTYLETERNNHVNDKSAVNENSTFNTVMRCKLKRGFHHELIDTLSM